MSEDDTIVAAAVIETDFGEKVALDSPYETKDLIKYLPWKSYAEEIEEYGSLKKKAEARGTNTKTSDLMRVFDEYERYGFSDDFATHASWDPDAIPGESGAWTIDVEAFDEAADFFGFCGYNVEVATSVNLEAPEP
jgi:hypothetical protein